MYLGIRNTTIEEPIQYATNHIKSQVTIYLYDIGLDNSYCYDNIDRLINHDHIKNQVTFIYHTIYELW